jgi:hypothetical protein
MQNPALFRRRPRKAAARLPGDDLTMEVVNETETLCAQCLTIIPASVVSGSGQLYLKSKCPIHGEQIRRHAWQRPSLYRRIMSLPASGRWEDDHASLVLNITNECNIRCPYCYAFAGESEPREMTAEDVRKILRSYRGGAVFLSGGEPGIAHDFFEICCAVKNSKAFKLVVFSNGIELAKNSFVRRLKSCGIDSVILQFDSLEDSRHIRLRGIEMNATKALALENLNYFHIPAYLFCMISRGVNDDEIGSIIDFSIKNDAVNIINFNPVWEIGRFVADKKITPPEILDKVAEKLNISLDDFMDANEFAYYIGPILRKFVKTSFSNHPFCEASCYLFRTRKECAPLPKLLPLKKLNVQFRRLYEAVSSGKRAFLVQFVRCLPSIILTLIPYSYACLRMAYASILYMLRRDRSLYRFPFMSVIVGTFQNKENVDFKMQSSCNLLSDNWPKSEILSSACFRQILEDKFRENGHDEHIQNHLIKYRERVDQGGCVRSRAGGEK